MTEKFKPQTTDAGRLIEDMFNAFDALEVTDSPEVLGIKWALYDQFHARVCAVLGTYDDEAELNR
jgi:hypothetical protein